MYYEVQIQVYKWKSHPSCHGDKWQYLLLCINIYIYVHIYIYIYIYWHRFIATSNFVLSANAAHYTAWTTPHLYYFQSGTCYTQYSMFHSNIIMHGPKCACLNRWKTSASAWQHNLCRWIKLLQCQQMLGEVGKWWRHWYIHIYIHIYMIWQVIYPPPVHL